jgi:hypothetical protein
LKSLKNDILHALDKFQIFWGSVKGISVFYGHDESGQPALNLDPLVLILFMSLWSTGHFEVDVTLLMM